jgi:acyl phosphate:glycerol-3-phosphate acyltransferase
MTGLITAGVIGYLLGSIPFGLLLTRLAGHGDIRAIGSGNIGATNVLRTGNKTLAALTLLLDLAKGAIAVLIGLGWGEAAGLTAAAAVVIGHMCPVWLGFRGGKAGATGLGVLLALAWPMALVAALVWLLTAILTRYSSLATLIATVVAAAFAGFVLDRNSALLVAGIAVLIVIRHHENIRRLLAGTESRISLRKG